MSSILSIFTLPWGFRRSSKRKNSIRCKWEVVNQLMGNSWGLVTTTIDSKDKDHSTLRDTESIKPLPRNRTLELKDFLHSSQQLRVKRVEKSKKKKKNTSTLTTERTRNVQPDLWSSLGMVTVLDFVTTNLVLIPA